MMSELRTKYPTHYCREMGNFDFTYEEVTFEVLKDFNNWVLNAFHDGVEAVVIFSRE